jgi:hypothetical protein
MLVRWRNGSMAAMEISCAPPDNQAARSIFDESEVLILRVVDKASITSVIGSDCAASFVGYHRSQLVIFLCYAVPLDFG